MGKAYQQPKIDTKNKAGSLAFFLAIPCSILGGMLMVISLCSIVAASGIARERWILFLFGFACALGLFATKSLQTIKTVIHELKHAALVIISGNTLTEFKVHKGAGHVSYQLYKSRMHIAPFIILAPYFFPFFSLPVIIVAIGINLALDSTHDFVIAIILGFALGSDLITSWQDFHPHQTDLNRVSGGIIAAYLFIIGTNFFWIVCCLTWVQSALIGFSHLAQLFISLMIKLIGA